MLLPVLMSLVFVAESPDVRVLKEDDQEFVCFTPDNAQELLQLHMDFPVLKLQNEKLESLNVLGETENARLESEIDELYLEIGDQRVLLEELDARLEKEDKWYAHPVFHVVTGFLTGVVTGMLVMHFSS